MNRAATGSTALRPRRQDDDHISFLRSNGQIHCRSKAAMPICSTARRGMNQNRGSVLHVSVLCITGGALKCARSFNCNTAGPFPCPNPAFMPPMGPMPGRELSLTKNV